MRRLLLLSLLICSAPLAAKDSLGVFDDWGAFRDPGRCCNRPAALSTLHVRGERCLKIGRYSAVHTRIALADRTRSAVSAGDLSAMLDRKAT